jgi:hypothetical protein
MERYIHWVEEHPGESFLIGGGIVLVLLWLLGYFSSSSSGSGSSNLASAYYAAEAQQAVVGGQIQMAHIAATASTAQTNLNDQAAIAINAANTGAAMTINQQNASAATTINAANVGGATAINAAQVAGAAQIAQIQGTTYQVLGSDQLLASENNAAYALAAVQSNNAALTTMNAANNATSQYNALIGSSIIPTELHLTGGGGYLQLATPASGAFDIGTGGAGVDLNALKAEGYSSSQADQIAAVGGMFGSGTQSYAQQANYFSGLVNSFGGGR